MNIVEQAKVMLTEAGYEFTGGVNHKTFTGGSFWAFRGSRRAVTKVPCMSALETRYAVVCIDNHGAIDVAMTIVTRKEKERLEALISKAERPRRRKASA